MGDEAIFNDLTKDYPVDYIAGGATQNSIRVAQWVLGQKYATSYFGCVGKGSDPVVCAENGTVVEFPAEKLPASKIVDTNGAGDAFVGGFLAQYVLGKDLGTAVRCGIWAATHIIQRSGCTLPDVMDFKA